MLNEQLVSSLVERVILCSFNCVDGVVHTAAVPSVCYKSCRILCTYVKSYNPEIDCLDHSKIQYGLNS